MLGLATLANVSRQRPVRAALPDSGHAGLERTLPTTSARRLDTGGTWRDGCELHPLLAWGCAWSGCGYDRVQLGVTSRSTIQGGRPRASVGGRQSVMLGASGTAGGYTKVPPTWPVHSGERTRPSSRT